MKRYIFAFTLVGISVAYAVCTSPDGTTIPPATEIFAADGSTWTLNSSNEVLRNNTDTFQAAPEVLYQGGNIFAKDSSSNWHQYAGWVPVANPTVTPPPQTITAAFLSANFHQTFSDGFAAGLPTICLNGTFSATCNWYNGTEQCCMSPTPQPGNVGGAMFPTAVGANGPYNPYSNNPAGGLLMTMHTETTTDATHTFTSVFSGVVTSATNNFTQGFLQQYGYFEATMQVSSNVGTWPAFWMLSPSKNMEIDVVEYYAGNGHVPGHYFATSHDYASGALYGPNEFGGALNADLSTGFHQFGVLIDAGTIAFYLDRQFMGSTPTPPDAKQPMFMLFDQGSSGGWPTCAGPSQVGVSPPVAGTSCSQGAAQLEGAVLAVQSVNVWQHN